MPKVRSKDEKVINIILSGELKAKIKIQAIKEQLSMNAYVVKVLSESVNKEVSFEKDEGYMSTGELQKLQDI